MKKSTFLSFALAVVAFFGSATAMAQENKAERKSPPATASATISGSAVTINYSQPAVNGRKIWGDLVPYGKVWRTGANEATTFETKKDVNINGMLLPAGKYSLFTIPGETEWTLIFNKKWEQWGAYKYSEKEDQLRVPIVPTKSAAFHEKMTFTIDNNVVFLRWEDLETSFKITEATH